MRLHAQWTTAIAWCVVFWACHSHPTPVATDVAAERKIAFDLEAIDDQGLRGGPGALRSVGYEFCIPADPAAREEVTAIDPTLSCHEGSPGRIGCREDRWLCMGNSHQPDFRGVLVRLAKLPYVERIEESHFE